MPRMRGCSVWALTKPRQSGTSIARSRSQKPSTSSRSRSQEAVLDQPVGDRGNLPGVALGNRRRRAIGWARLARL